MRTLHAFALSAFLLLVSCVSHVDQVFTPTGGVSEVATTDDAPYTNAAAAASIGVGGLSASGNGWAEGWYSMGYPPAGSGGSGSHCLGASCHCPVGWTSATFDASVLLTEPTAIAMQSNGKPKLTLENDVNVNSSNVGAITLGGTSSVKGPEFFVVGGTSVSSNATLTGVVHTAVAALSDPLAYLPVPDPSLLTTRSTSLLSISGQTVELQPGLYIGGISLGSSAKVTLAPGLYYLQGGGLAVASGATLAGSEVTFYVSGTTDTVSIQGGASVSVTPPEDGELVGMTFFLNRSNATAMTITGGGNLSIYGTIYAPAATANIGGNGTMVAGSQIVAAKINLSGNSVTSVTATTAQGVVARPPGCFHP